MCYSYSKHFKKLYIVHLQVRFPMMHAFWNHLMEISMKIALLVVQYVYGKIQVSFFIGWLMLWIHLTNLWLHMETGHSMQCACHKLGMPTRLDSRLWKCKSRICVTVHSKLSSTFFVERCKPCFGITCTNNVN